MFKSILPRRNTQAKSGDNNSSAMDTSEEETSFVHVHDENINIESLSLKLTPRYDVIGTHVHKKSTQFCATVTARDLPDDDSARAPVDIVVALDVSSSMSGAKLELCKTTLSLLLRELNSNDRFGLVSFGSDVKLEIPTRKLTKFNKTNALAKVKDLRTHGCTNMSGGIGMAAQEIKSLDQPNEVQTIFLLTDGYANQGVSDRVGIVNLTKGCLASDSGKRTPIHCFGYGEDHDSEMLRDIAQASEGGSYYFVNNDSDVSSAFGDALGGVLSVVAQNTIVSLKVPQTAANAGILITEVKHDKAVKNHDGTYSIALNDFYAEESRDIVFEVALSKECNPSPVLHVTSTMSYLDTINSKLIQSGYSDGLIARPVGEATSNDNEHVVLQCIRVKTTEVIAQAEKLANNGDLAVAKTVVKSQIDVLNKQAELLTQPSQFLTQMVNELNSILAGFSSRTTYESTGAKYLQSRVQTHKMQRCSEASEKTQNTYKSSSKYRIASKFRNESC
jgi:Mg-chelatase subunit ChlD